MWLISILLCYGSIFSDSVQHWSLRRVRTALSSEYVLERIPAESYIKKSIIKSLISYSGLLVMPDQLDELTEKVSIDKEIVRSLIAQRLSEVEGELVGEINVLDVIDLIDDISLQLEKEGIRLKSFTKEEKLILAENISEALFDIRPEEIFLDQKGRYIFYAYVEEIEELPRVYFEEKPKTWEETLEFYERYGIKREWVEEAKKERSGFLEIADPRVVVHRVNILEGFINRRSAKPIPKLRKYLLVQARKDPIHVMNRARAFDRLVEEEGLKVSYRFGDGIEVVAPELLKVTAQNVRENLALMRQEGIDHIKYRNLFFVSTFKLSTNIRFLKRIGIDVSQRAYLLGNRILWLQDNYLLLSIMGAEAKSSYLNLTTPKLIEKIKEGKIRGSLSQEQVELLRENVEEMLSAQEEFFKWWRAEDELITPEEKAQRQIFNIMRGKASSLFEEYGLEKLNLPAYSLFSLMTYIYIPNRLGQAVLELARISLAEPERISSKQREELVDELVQKYRLTEMDRFNLGMILSKEIRQREKNKSL